MASVSHRCRASTGRATVGFRSRMTEVVAIGTGKPRLQRPECAQRAVISDARRPDRVQVGRCERVIRIRERRCVRRLGSAEGTQSAMTIHSASLGLRQSNRLRVIETLYNQPGTSRAELARTTGLSRATVSMLVEELEEANIVEEHDAGEDIRPRNTGRPPIPLSLVPSAAFAVGLDVGRQHIRVAVCDLSGRPVLDEWSPRRGRPRADGEPRPRVRARPLRARAPPASSRTACSASAWASPHRSTPSPASWRRTGSFPVGTGSALPPRWSSVSASPCSWTTMPTSAPSVRRCSASPAASTTLIYVRLSAGVGAGPHPERPALPRCAWGGR